MKPLGLTADAYSLSRSCSAQVGASKPARDYVAAKRPCTCVQTRSKAPIRWPELSSSRQARADTGMRRHADALPASERLYRLQNARASQLERLRAEAATAELAGCSFAPQLDDRKASRHANCHCLAAPWGCSARGRACSQLVPTES